MALPFARGLHRRLRTAVRPEVRVGAPPPDVQVEWNLPIRLRDGVTLRANVFRPAGPGPFPVLLCAHPYDKDAIPARSRTGRRVNFQYRLFPQPELISISAWTSWEAPDPAFWTGHGYAVVNADLRGGGTAEGVSELFSDLEAADYAEIIGWAGTQPWSTGRVGLLGVSYLAISQYKVAALRPPQLAAICPWEGFTDLYRDFARPGGIAENDFAIIWSAMTRKQARVHGNLRREQLARPERDGWYAERTPDLAAIEVPMLVCASFSDHNLHSRGSFEAYRRAGSTEKWLYTHRDGKWSHFYGEAARATQLEFFDRYVKQQDNGWQQHAPVRLAVHETRRAPAEIRREASWPPADLNWRRLFLDAGTGGLGEAVPAPGQASLASRGAGLRFDWMLPGDLDVIGPAALRVYLQVAGADDVHLFAVLRKLRHGREVTFEGSFGFAGDPMTTGWQRAAFRRLDPLLSTPEQPVHTYRDPQPVRPGEIVALDVALLPHATRLRAGERLRLELRGRWPQPRNPVTGQFPSGYARSPRGRCTLHTGPEHRAYLLLGTRPV
ncbi:MAG TPA: CocE/NonD family hydrolase [Jatrophihabitans sp.]|nr:CocE/NonD family hydrolase [Jatrophihabitans sp.]